MADSHLFFTMTNAVKVCRMSRRKRIEALEGMIDMYNTAYTEPEDYDIGVMLERELDSIIEMNTDAFGLAYFPSYRAIMTEATKRNMREPLNPLYEKEPI